MVQPQVHLVRVGMLANGVEVQRLSIRKAEKGALMHATLKPPVKSNLPTIRIWGDYNEDLVDGVLEIVVSDNKSMFNPDTVAVMDILAEALRKAGYKTE